MITKTQYVAEYVDCVIQIRNALATLTEFVDSLPAPDDDHELPTINYAEVGGLKHIRSLIASAVQHTDGFEE